MRLVIKSPITNASNRAMLPLSGMVTEKRKKKKRNNGKVGGTQGKAGGKWYAGGRFVARLVVHLK